MQLLRDGGFAVAVLAVLAFSGCGSGDPVQSPSVVEAAPPRGEIIYVRRTGTSRGDIFATSVDGRRTRRLTRTPQLEQDLAVSPDGRRLVFTRPEPGMTGGIFRHAGIWVLETASGRARQLTTGASDHDPAWTNDGTKLVFARAVESPRRQADPADAIMSIRPADAVTRTLVQPRFDDEDGTCEIALTRWPGRDLVVFVHITNCLRDWGGHPMKAVDSRGRVITVLDWLESFAFLRQLDFSPDGKMLAFYGTADINGGDAAYVSTVSGMKRRQVRLDGPPSWSVDGAWLVGIRNGDVWIVRPDGSGARRVTRTPQEEEESPAWNR